MKLEESIFLLKCQAFKFRESFTVMHGAAAVVFPMVGKHQIRRTATASVTGRNSEKHNGKKEKNVVVKRYFVTI